MFMLMGIVKKNGIMIVDFARQRVEAGEAAERAIHDASMDRFRPILMTTLAAVIGAVPIALGFGADGASRRPLGLVIVGGLIVSQFITLYVTPVIYLYLEQFQKRVLDRTSLLPLRSASGGRPRGGERPESVAGGSARRRRKRGGRRGAARMKRCPVVTVRARLGPPWVRRRR